MEAPLQTLIVGVGTRGKHWVRLVYEEPNTVPVGFVDPLPECLAWVQDEYDAPPDQCFSNMTDALAATNPDLVVLATPPMGHLEEAREIFAAGCHLLAEKPLSIEFAETVEIVRLAEEADRSLTVGLNFRYLPTTLKAKELIANEIGKPSFARFMYWMNRDGRRPGINKYPLTMHQPMLYEQSIHHLDLFRFTYDAEVERVWCRCHNPPWSMYADDATVTNAARDDWRHPRGLFRYLVWKHKGQPVPVANRLCRGLALPAPAVLRSARGASRRQRTGPSSRRRRSRTLWTIRERR